jgi:hypothetical protein
MKIEQAEQPPLKKVKWETGVARSWKLKNKDLPEGATAGNTWRRIFIPTYTVYAASSGDPWSVKDDDAVAKMQLIWNAIYQLEHDITIDGAVFRIVRISSKLRHQN